MKHFLSECSSRRNTCNVPHPPFPSKPLSPDQPKFVKQCAVEVDSDIRKTENLVSYRVNAGIAEGCMLQN